jgi:hypothetical protein
VPADRNRTTTPDSTTTDHGRNQPRPIPKDHQGKHPLDREPLFRHADIAEIDVTPLGKSGAMVTVHWNVVEEAGALLRDFRTTYHLLRADEAWRILSYTNHDE